MKMIYLSLVILILLVDLISYALSMYGNKKSLSKDALKLISENERNVDYHTSRKTVNVVISVAQYFFLAGLLVFDGISYAQNEVSNGVLLFIILMFIPFLYYLKFLHVYTMEERHKLVTVGKIGYFIGTGIFIIILLTIYALVVGNLTQIESFFGLAFVMGMTILIFGYITLQSVVKFNEIDDEVLINLIDSFADEHQIEYSNVYIINRSKYSNKITAFVKGLFKIKNIYLSDTLVNQFSNQEIISVVAHEMGHLKYNDLRKQVCFFLMTILGFFGLGSFIYDNSVTLSDFAYNEPNIIATLFIWYILVQSISRVLKPMLYQFLRKMEKRADEFSVETTGNEHIFNVLKVYGETNCLEINPHPFDVAFNYTHPPITERLEYIKCYRTRVNLGLNVIKKTPNRK